MRLYSTYPLASMSFSSDPLFVQALDVHIAPREIDTIIETGTYLGLGSTRILAEFFSRTKVPKRFVTFEVNWLHFQQAKVNLRRFGFIDCRWGTSVSRNEALAFIRSDDAIKNHHQYPEIWIDDVANPVAFYSNEMMGAMAHQKTSRLGHTWVSWLARTYGVGNTGFLWDGDELLAQACNIHRSHRPLILLDSAGGTGYLEFQTVLRTMGEAEYFLILDDIHHLKHFRSLRHVRNDTRFEIMAINPQHGWAIVHHALSSRGQRAEAN